MRKESSVWAGTRAGARTLALVLALAAAGSGCSDDETTQPADEFAPPTNLTYLNDDNAVVLDWQGSPDASLGDFAGYAIYRHTASMAGATPSELAGYRLNAQPRALADYTDDTAVNGQRYFYAVRAVKDDGDLSEPTNQIDTAPRPVVTDDEPNDTIELFEFAAANEPSGLRLATGESFRMLSSSPDNRDSVDVYLGTSDPNDATGQPLALKSPHLVDGTGTTWAAEAQLKLLDSWDVPTTSTSGWSNTVVLGSTDTEIVGKVIGVRAPTRGGEYHYAKLQVMGFTDEAGRRHLSARVAYQPIPGYLRFSLAR